MKNRDENFLTFDEIRKKEENIKNSKDSKKKQIL